MSRSGRVDAHVHARGGYAPLAASWPLLAAGGVERVVLVQQLDRYDNAELLAEAADDRVLGVVVGVDLGDPRAADALGAVLGHPKVRGVRFSPAQSWSAPADVRLWPTLEEHGLLVSLPPAFDRIVAGDAAEVARTHPESTIRLEHLGGTRFSDVPADDPRFAAFLALAEHDRVTTTWSGFFHNAVGGFPYAEAHPHLAASLARFGAERIAWSGDVNRAAIAFDDYACDAQLLRELPFLSEADRRRISSNSLLSEEDR